MSSAKLIEKAHDVAREALLDAVPTSDVGDFLDFATTSEDDAASVATYNFQCTSASYPGWYWSVLVVAVSGQDHCTVSDVSLLPGAQALIPPAWKPWADRVEAGDLGVGDLLPPAENDERLTAGFTGIDDLAPELEPLHPRQWELGLGREKVLSDVGLDKAVARWMAGQTGPRSAMAKAAPAQCSTCGFLVPIGGSLGQAFGMCANEFGAADGQVVAMSFGCGAHSAVVATTKAPVPVVDLVVDDVADDLDQRINDDLPAPDESDADLADELETQDLLEPEIVDEADEANDELETQLQDVDVEAEIDEASSEFEIDAEREVDFESDSN